jgi:hypothetical protein
MHFLSGLRKKYKQKIDKKPAKHISPVEKNPSKNVIARKIKIILIPCGENFGVKFLYKL